MPLGGADREIVDEELRRLLNELDELADYDEDEALEYSKEPNIRAKHEYGMHNATRFDITMVASILSSSERDYIAGDSGKRFLLPLKATIPTTIDLYKDEAALTILLGTTFEVLVQYALIYLYAAVYRLARSPQLKRLALRALVKRSVLLLAKLLARYAPDKEEEDIIARYIAAMSAIYQGKPLPTSSINASLRPVTTKIRYVIYKMFRFLTDSKLLEDVLPTGFAALFFFYPILIASYCRTHNIVSCVDVLRHQASWYAEHKGFRDWNDLYKFLVDKFGPDLVKAVEEDEDLAKLFKRLIEEKGTTISSAIDVLLELPPDEGTVEEVIGSEWVKDLAEESKEGKKGGQTTLDSFGKKA
ncbi:MAG: hypothetical protein ABGW50_02040 [Thermococcus sp.]